MNRFIFLFVTSIGIICSTFSFALEEAIKLETTGIFKKNDKGVLILTDDTDKKKYYGFNKGVNEKVGDLVGEKVNVNARVKKKEGAKITLMTYIVAVNPVGPEAMVRGVAKAFAAKDYVAFKKFTCFGMRKDEFKRFMAKNDDRKVVRTWNPIRNDFQEEMIIEMQKAYAEILQETREKGFNWSQAKIMECEQDDDVKAFLRSGNIALYLHLDDCFITPKGLLTFDAPRAKVRQLAPTTDKPNRFPYVEK